MTLSGTNSCQRASGGILLRLAITFLGVVTSGCSALSCPAPAAGLEGITGIYRFPVDTLNGLVVWIMDGPSVRRSIYPAFLFGGNAQRYTFVPAGEIWIDNSITAEEFTYTVAHEMLERRLMGRFGWTYDAAHDSALALEQSLRRADLQAVRIHEETLPKVSPTDYDTVKEITALPDSLNLRRIYRVPLGTRAGVQLWIVDGAAVRRDIYPDFGMSGNDLAYHFIPRGEIWIDAQTSCEELEFSIRTELIERHLMDGGMSYDDAFETAVREVQELRRRLETVAARHQPLHFSPPLDRDKGTGSDRP